MPNDSRRGARSHLADAGLDVLPDGWDVAELGDLLSQDRGIAVGVMYPGDTRFALLHPAKRIMGHGPN